jgi:hypothetical protein
MFTTTTSFIGFAAIRGADPPASIVGEETAPEIQVPFVGDVSQTTNGVVPFVGDGLMDEDTAFIDAYAREFQEDFEAVKDAYGQLTPAQQLDVHAAIRAGHQQPPMSSLQAAAAMALLEDDAIMGDETAHMKRRYEDLQE